MLNETCPIPGCLAKASLYKTALSEPAWVTCPQCGRFVMSGTEFANSEGVFGAYPVSGSELRDYVQAYSARFQGDHSPINSHVLKGLTGARRGLSFERRIDRVGFFHFPRHHETPIEQLRCALHRERKRLEGGRALIVLPEGFNIRKDYRKPGDGNINPEVIGELEGIAEEFDVVFVAGLIVAEDSGPRPPFNSCFLISGRGSSLLCRKFGRDGNPNTPYTECHDEADQGNGIAVEGLFVFGTMCMDVDVPHRGHLFRAAAFAWGLPVVECIPASMSSSAYGLDSFHQRGPNAIVILANSASEGIGSIICIPGRDPVKDTGEKNRVQVALLDPTMKGD